MSPGSRPALLAVFALLAVTATLVAGTALADQPDALPQQAQQDDGVLDRNTTTEIHVTLHGDSDARFTITERFNVSDPLARSAFADVADRFESGEAAQLGLPSFREARQRVAANVDREMRIHEVRHDTSVEEGTLSVSFTWTNFAREVNETRIVDDAFHTEAGTWLDGLGPGESLVIELPRGSALDTPKAVTDGTIRWDGPATFQPGDLEISYTADPQPQIPPLLWGVGLALLVFTVVGVAGAYLLSRRDGDLPLSGIPTGGSDDGVGHRTGTEPSDAAPPAESGDDEAEAEGEDVDLSLLSDEERVEYLIEQNGGRMKQANIVKETGWSNAKVSQLLSSMEEEGRIAKLRIGRENLISFPDEDIGEFEDS